MQRTWYKGKQKEFQELRLWSEGFPEAIPPSVRFDNSQSKRSDEVDFFLIMYVR